MPVNFKAAAWMCCLLFALASCQKEVPVLTDQNPLTDPALQELKEQLDADILATIRETGRPFDWNTASLDMLFDGIRVTENLLVVGYRTQGWNDAGNRDVLLREIYASEGIEARSLGMPDDVLVYKDDRLGFFYARVKKKETLERLSAHSATDFLEVSAYPILVEELTASLSDPRHKPEIPSAQQRARILDPLITNPEYATQVSWVSGGTATTIRRHNVDKVYRDHQIFGEGIGIAVLDNGVLPEHFQFIAENGYGQREALGYYNPLWFLPFTQPDGTSPQTPDVLFLSQLIEGQWLHGWQQNEEVVCIAPNAFQKPVRSSPLVLLFAPSQVLGVINSIVALADDPDVKVLSMSMGSLFQVNHLANAVNYLNSKDKILVSAAGTSFPVIRDLLGVIFPATLPTTVAATGIENRNQHDGAFVLGVNSHGGPQVDFCVENASSSSPATSRLAAMMGLVWSANPSLTRAEVIDIVKQSSYFYQLNGAKDPVLGWGTPDILQAVELALEE